MPAKNKMESPLYYFYNDVVNQKQPPVLLIHGAGGFHLSWPPHIRRMQGRSAYALDLNGHGKSQGPGHETIEEHVEDVLHFMNSLALEQVVLAGHSMGGAIILQIALKYPQRVSGLILVSTGAKLRVNPSLLDAASKADTFSHAVDLVIDSSFSRHVDIRIRELSRQRMMQIDPRALHADLLACHSFNVLDSLPGMSAPTMILCGEEDVMSPPKYSQTLHEQISNSRLELIPEAGHMLMLEKPKEVKDFMNDFLELLE
jgi:pimeloyl-ACP methyl ester carboxylesterase